MIAEHVAEGRGFDAFGMGAFFRFFELLGVAQEDDAGGGVGGGEGVARGQAFACLKAGFALGEGHLDQVYTDGELDRPRDES